MNRRAWKCRVSCLLVFVNTVRKHCLFTFVYVCLQRSTARQAVRKHSVFTNSLFTFVYFLSRPQYQYRKRICIRISACFMHTYQHSGRSMQQTCQLQLGLRESQIQCACVSCSHREWTGLACRTRDWCTECRVVLRARPHELCQRCANRGQHPALGRGAGDASRIAHEPRVHEVYAHPLQPHLTTDHRPQSSRRKTTSPTVRAHNEEPTVRAHAVRAHSESPQ